MCPCRGWLGTLKTLAAHGVGSPAAGQNLENGQLSRHCIAEISLNMTLNHNQPTNQLTDEYMYVKMDNDKSYGHGQKLYQFHYNQSSQLRCGQEGLLHENCDM